MDPLTRLQREIKFELLLLRLRMSPAYCRAIRTKQSKRHANLFSRWLVAMARQGLLFQPLTQSPHPPKNGDTRGQFYERPNTYTGWDWHRRA